MAATVWKGFITFGLISIPVRLFRAARPERVNLRVLSRSGAARPEQAKKGFEYAKGRFVSVEPEELKSIAPQTTTEMAIEEFVALDEIDPVYFEASYYVAPEKAGEKAYALLYRSLQLTRLVALAQFAMHNRGHVVVLRPGHSGLLAHTMFYAPEVRARDEFHADTSTLTAKELDLAKTLIRSLTGSFEPEKYHDTYREKLEAMLSKKAAGKPVSAAASAEPRKQAKVVDIADALRASLANLKKPPAAAAPAKKARRAGSGR
jgi:DNA end-binding protein Ku